MEIDGGYLQKETEAVGDLFKLFVDLPDHFDHGARAQSLEIGWPEARKTLNKLKDELADSNVE